MKKPVIIGIILLVVIGLAFTIFKITTKKSSDVLEDEFLEETTILPPIEERPYVLMTPTSDGHNIKIDVSNIIQATKVEYELLYFAGDTPRGAIGKEILNGKSQFSRELMFGSCSSGGKCSFDEGVESGGLTLKIASGSKLLKMEAPFMLEKGGKGKSYSSNTQFSISGDLPTGNYLIYSPLGLPSPFKEGKIVSEPYQVTSSGNATLKATIKIKLNETSPSAFIYGWDTQNKTWKKLSSKMETDGSTISVEVDRLTTFVAASAS